MYPLGNVWTHCLRNLNVSSMCPPGKCPLAPSVNKCEHNRLLRELGGKSLPDSYIAILICSGLPEHLKQSIAHIPDNTITTDQIVNIIRSRQQESMINTMQASPSDNALLGHHKSKQKKHNFQPCKTPGCPRPSTHPTQNCWAPGGPKHNPNRQRKLNRRNKEWAHKADDDDDDDDSSTTSMNIHIDRSFIAKSDSDLLYVSPPETSTSSNASQAYIAKGPTPIIIDSGTTSHIHNEWSDFNSLDKDDINNITGDPPPSTLRLVSLSPSLYPPPSSALAHFFAIRSDSLHRNPTLPTLHTHSPLAHT